MLRRIEALRIADWYLAGGCLFQTVWNHLHGFAPEHGILDYDLLYFDDSSLSESDESRVQAAVGAACAQLPVRIEVCNQARVHQWYEAKWHVRSPPFRRCSDGIDAFLACCCSVGIRQSARGLALYAPHGLQDLFNLVVRPNPSRSGQGSRLAAAYREKTLRWKSIWPGLQIIPWPADGAVADSVALPTG
ncbi:MAG TPA: nucleotidyltransferase family protein, partial [Steroidobacteraceae bacterium]|nr:nucleotidyltransferase family protein [Steroidobacteraceae bacterium]